MREEQLRASYEELRRILTKKRRGFGTLIIQSPPAATPATPAGVFTSFADVLKSTSSVTDVHLGFGSTFTVTPSVTGKLIVCFSSPQITGSGNFVSSASAIINSFRYGTGTAPANGAAVTGNKITSMGTDVLAWSVQLGTDADMSGNWIPGSVCIMGYVTGLTLSTAYWFDITANSSAAFGTVNFTHSYFWSFEVPT